jgi:protein SCO1/2
VRWPLLLLALIGVLAGGPSSADTLRDPFAAIGIDSAPGAQVPAEAQFKDETGRVVALGDYLGHGPVILAPVYYRCPNLCGTTLRRLAASLGKVPLSPGTDYTVVAVSIDPREEPADAAEVKAQALESQSNAAHGGFHFLTGSEADIESVMQAIGFRYRWDPELQQYAHAAAIAVLTPQGKIARWLYGFSYEPADLRLALVEAGQGRTGSLTDRILLLCYHYNPITGRYDGLIQNVLQWACAATALGLFGLAAWCIRRERRAKAMRRRGVSA